LQILRRVLCHSEGILKIGRYLTKLCVDYVGLLFLAHPVYIHYPAQQIFSRLPGFHGIFPANSRRSAQTIIQRQTFTQLTAG